MHRPSFSLRMLLCLVTVVAITLGIAVPQRNHSTWEHEVARQLGGKTSCVFAKVTPIPLLGQRITDFVMGDRMVSLEMIRDGSIEGVPRDDYLLGLTNLHRLTLVSDAKLFDASLLRNLTQLTDLDLIEANVRDAAPLRHLSTVRRLSLHGAHLLDLRALSELRQIDSLRLIGYPGRDGTLLGHLDQLKSLDVQLVNIQNWEWLERMNQLEHLDASDTSLKDLTPLRGLHQLKTLILARTHVSDLTPLNELRSLESIDIRHSKVVDISSLAEISTLVEANLSYCRIKDPQKLQTLRQLRVLTIHGVLPTDEEVTQLRSDLPNCVIDDQPLPDAGSVVE